MPSEIASYRMARIRIRVLLLSCAALCLLSASETVRDLAPEFWKQTHLKIGVAAVAFLPFNNYEGHRLEPEFGPDNPTPAEVHERFRAYRSAADRAAEPLLNAARREIVRRFIERGFQVVPITDYLSNVGLRDFEPPRRGNWPDKDYREFRKYDIDVLVILSVEKFGFRDWSNTLIFDPRLRAIDLSDNSLLGSASISHIQGRVNLRNKSDREIARAVEHIVPVTTKQLIDHLFR